jgi:hypothetical protein
MSNPQKRKGDEFELDVKHWLKAHGFPWTEKTRAGYERDTGDLHLIPGPLVIGQAKNQKTWKFAEWMRQLTQQIGYAKAQHGALIVKRRGVGDVGQAWVVLTLDQWTRLLRDAGYGSEPEAIPIEPGQLALTDTP